MQNKEEYQQPSPIVRLWYEEELARDIKELLQNPYSWISNELKKSSTRRRHGPDAEKFDVLMEMLDLLNAIYFPTENHHH